MKKLTIVVKSGDRPVEVSESGRKLGKVAPNSEACFDPPAEAAIIIRELPSPAEVGAAANARDDEALKQAD